MTDFTDLAHDHIAVNIARLYLRTHLSKSDINFPCWIMMAAMAIELGEMFHFHAEKKVVAPESLRHLLAIIEKCALNPTGEKLQ